MGATPEAPQQLAAFSGIAIDVAFSFTYPATWTVTDTDPKGEYAFKAYDIANEVGSPVASLTVLPYLEVEPCRSICDDIPVIQLGERPGDGDLGGNSYLVRTQAMDLTLREDLQQVHRWNNNVNLLTGVVGTSPALEEQDPQHFELQTGFSTQGSIESFRALKFGTSRFFTTVQEAKTYTSSPEYLQLQAMFTSFQATATSVATENAASTHGSTGP